MAAKAEFPCPSVIALLKTNPEASCAEKDNSKTIRRRYFIYLGIIAERSYLVKVNCSEITTGDGKCYTSAIDFFVV